MTLWIYHVNNVITVPTILSRLTDKNERNTGFFIAKISKRTNQKR